MIFLILGLYFSICTITINSVAEIEIRSQIPHLLKARPCSRVRVDCSGASMFRRQLEGSDHAYFPAVHLGRHDFRVLQTLPCFSSSGIVFGFIFIFALFLHCNRIEFMMLRTMKCELWICTVQRAQLSLILFSGCTALLLGQRFLAQKGTRLLLFPGQALLKTRACKVDQTTVQHSNFLSSETRADA
jgi:hypothetical protein